MEAWFLTGQLADRLPRAIKIGGDHRWCEPQHHAVAVAMDGHFVAFSTNPLGQLREGANLLANEEEGRLRAGSRQQVKHRGRALRVRAVIKGQRDPTAAIAAAWHAKRLSERRNERRQGRQRPGRASTRAQ